MEKKISFKFISSMFDDIRERKIVEYILEGKTPKEIVDEIAKTLCRENKDD